MIVSLAHPGDIARIAIDHFLALSETEQCLNMAEDLARGAASASHDPLPRADLLGPCVSPFSMSRRSRSISAAPDLRDKLTAEQRNRMMVEPCHRLLLGARF